MRRTRETSTADGRRRQGAAPEVITGDMPPPMPTDMPITDEQIDATCRRWSKRPRHRARRSTHLRILPASRPQRAGHAQPGPGFDIITGDQGRGLGQASDNVIINGERVASKSESLFDVLQRIPADRVQRIEIVDGATLGIPGLAGQIANVLPPAARSAAATNGARSRGRNTPRPAMRREKSRSAVRPRASNGASRRLTASAAAAPAGIGALSSPTEREI
jgi:hypothetical protein